MTLTVLLFAQAREAAGGLDAIALDLPGDEATAAGVLAAIVSRGGDLARVASRARLAVNRTFARPEARVAPGDEVALIPPVGGG